MKLTRQEAIDKSIELWEWLKETGKKKDDYAWKGEDVASLCYLCEYAGYSPTDGNCSRCPYHKLNQKRCWESGTNYYKWEIAETPRTRKKYAALFLEELKALK